MQTYVNIDDCWANWNRTADGKLAPNSTRFPHGMNIHQTGGAGIQAPLIVYFV
jgi:hypothetical protein